MLFNSFEFFIFFILITVLYFVLPHKYRWMLLLTASCVFYMFFIPAYILILIFTIVIDYFAGIFIENSKPKNKRKWLVASLIANIGVLAIFKYFNFLNDNLTQLLGIAGSVNPVPYLDIILPIGLSFHTFQAMSYTIEVYRCNQKAEKHFGIYALYVMFYPQLVAGPIERPQNLIHQFRQVHTFEYNRVASGLKRMVWGLFKKVVIADRLAVMVDAVYDHPGEFSGIPVILATVFFAFQIYCDFSGYSDIAIGAAQVMGFNLMTNFNFPYFSKSIAEFWKRWHISLSTWFRDYLYISLGGNRVGKSRWFFNLFFTFLISGLWHGANWTFIIWGALHGTYLIFALLTQSIREKINQSIGLRPDTFIWNWCQSISVFILVCFAWIFFRANNLSEAVLIIKQSAALNIDQFKLTMFGNNYFELIAAIFFILVLLLIEGVMYKGKIFDWIRQRPVWMRWSLYGIIVMLIINFGVFGGNSFIYFQF